MIPEIWGRVKVFNAFAQGYEFELERIPSTFNSLIFADTINLITNRKTAIGGNPSYVDLPVINSLFTHDLFNFSEVEDSGISPTSFYVRLKEVTR